MSAASSGTDARATSSCPFSKSCHKRCRTGKDRRSACSSTNAAASASKAPSRGAPTFASVRRCTSDKSPANIANGSTPRLYWLRASASMPCASPANISPNNRRIAPRSDRPSMSRTCAAVTLPSPSMSAWAMAWSSIDRPSRTDPSAACATRVSASTSASTCSLTEISAKWSASFAVEIRLRSNR